MEAILNRMGVWVWMLVEDVDISYIDNLNGNTR